MRIEKVAGIVKARVLLDAHAEINTRAGDNADIPSPFGDEISELWVVKDNFVGFFSVLRSVMASLCIILFYMKVCKYIPARLKGCLTDKKEWVCH
jgi:hypothetical protein